MSQTKSPFLVFQDFLEPEDCDKIAQEVRVIPNVDPDGTPLAMERHYAPLEDDIFEKLKKLTPKLESHYTGFKYRGTEHLIFQQFPATGKMAEEPHCENAVYKRKKWVKVRDRDLTGVLWLKDYRDTPPFNTQTQVLGGKLEFPVYNFGFQPQKGTLVLYPACERFIALTSAILVGELQCVRVHIAGHGNWLYDPVGYPGDFRTWFSQVI